MKKLLLSLTLLVGFAVHAAAETVPSAKAIYCEANTTLYFTYDDEPYNTFTAYEQLDGNTPTEIYNNISPTGYTGFISRVLSQSNVATPWKNYCDAITTLNFLDNFKNWKPQKLDYYFMLMKNLTTIVGGSNVNTSELTSLTNTFAICESLTNLDELATWDVSKISEFIGTFRNCSALTNISALKNWKLDSATKLEYTFFSCKSLTNLDDLSEWDVSKVYELDHTFGSCSSLLNVDALLNWDTSSLTDFYGTFNTCTSLTNVDGLKYWDTSKAENIAYVFNCCYALENIDGVKNWNTSSATNMEYTFNLCRSLTSDALMAIKDWDVSKVQLFYFFLAQCSSLTNLDALSEWQTTSAEDLSYIFARNYGLTDIKGLAKWDVSKVITMAASFYYCESLLSLEGLEDWDVSNVRTMASAFYYCKSLVNLDPISGWKTDKLGSLSYTFNHCESLIGRIDFSGWDLSNLNQTESGYCVTYNEHASSAALGWGSANSLNSTFADCPKIIGVTLGKGNIGKEANLNCSNTFLNCSKLRYLDISGCTDTYNNITYAKREGNEVTYSWGTRMEYDGMFGNVPRTCVIYLPSGNTQPTEGDLENVVYTDESELLQCDKYYSEDKVDIELPHRFHADLATYERPFSKTYAGVILPYPVKINDNASDEFQPFILQEEYVEQMFFKGSDNVPANTPFVFKRKGSTDMKFAMEDVWVESTYDVNGETSDNIDPEFKAWKSQGFYVSHEIEPENGKFNIPTMDDYVGTENVAYDPNKVYYIASNKFYRTDPSTLYLDPHRILYYGQWEKFSGDISGARPAAFTIEELDENSPAITAIQEAELRLDESRAAAIYDASGNRLSETKRGVNILRMADGSVKKVLRK